MPVIHYRLGVIYYVRESYSDAELQFRSALSLRPDFLNARNNLGITYAAMGELERAVDEFEEVLTANPTHKGARMNMDRAIQMLRDRNEDAASGRLQ